MNTLAGWTVAFDLDGTLVDTAPDLLRVLNEVLTEAGIPLPPAESARLMIGHGARHMIEKALLAAGRTVSEDAMSTMLDKFVALYAADIARESRPFPGLIPALEHLERAGALVCVCTNKRTALARQLLDALGLADRFRAIVGADAVPFKKPHPDHLRIAVARAGGDPGRAIMVGDSGADIGAAQAAGAPSVAVRFGYSEVDVDQLGADALIEHFDELAGVLERLSARA